MNTFYAHPLADSRLAQRHLLLVLALLVSSSIGPAGSTLRREAAPVVSRLTARRRFQLPRRDPAAESPATSLAAVSSVNFTLELSGVVGFWHIGPGGRQSVARSATVRKQLRDLKKFPIFHKVKINYLVDGGAVNDATKRLLQRQPSLTELALSDVFWPFMHKLRFEFPTLLRLWEHCQEHPSDLVFYLRTKTSDTARRNMQQALLGQFDQAISQLRGGMWVYGVNPLEHYPWCHIPENYWWARCDHVQRLRSPFNPRADAGALAWGNPWYSPPTGRYMAEYWLLNEFKGSNRPESTPKLRMRKERRKAWRTPPDAEPDDYCMARTFGDVSTKVAGPAQAITADPTASRPVRQSAPYI